MSHSSSNNNLKIPPVSSSNQAANLSSDHHHHGHHRQRSISAATINPETGTLMNNEQMVSNSSTNITSNLGTAATTNVDIPPDMAILLQKLDEDFLVNKVIDQWTFINRREEIMQSINRLHQKLQQDEFLQLDPTQLERPLNPRKATSEWQELSPHSLMDILAYRGTIYKTDLAFIVLDSKGKEVNSISWEKLYLKAVKVAYEIQHKMSMKNSDTVVLLYKDGEVAEFVVALFGCFMAGVTAIQSIKIYR